MHDHSHIPYRLFDYCLHQVYTYFNLELHRANIKTWPCLPHTDNVIIPLHSKFLPTYLSNSHFDTHILSLSLFHNTHILPHCQCDQIGRFIILWATFQSPGQPLFCPNRQHILGLFVKVSKSFI